MAFKISVRVWERNAILTRSYDRVLLSLPSAVQESCRTWIVTDGIARRDAWRGSWAACPAATSAASPAGRRRHSYTHCNQRHQHCTDILLLIYLGYYHFINIGTYCAFGKVSARDDSNPNPLKQVIIILYRSENALIIRHSKGSFWALISPICPVFQ